jgi:hypothetical protein
MTSCDCFVEVGCMVYEVEFTKEGAGFVLLKDTLFIIQAFWLCSSCCSPIVVWFTNALFKIASQTFSSPNHSSS